MKIEKDKIFYSLVLDNDPVLIYQSYYLVLSLKSHAFVESSNIFVHATSAVPDRILEIFDEMGVEIRRITPFGDSKYCNKIFQLSSNYPRYCECIILLDSDMIVLSSLDAAASATHIRAKVVDRSFPPLVNLKSTYKQAGLSLPKQIKVDFGGEETFLTNCNGGFYVIPAKFQQALLDRWKYWAIWVLENEDVFEQRVYARHVDQVAFSMAVHDLDLPLRHIGRAYNYPTHFNTLKLRYPKVLRYHRRFGSTGLVLRGRKALWPYRWAVAKANVLIRGNFNNEIFWPMRYETNPKLGSGVGSRGANAQAKREFLQELAIEEAESVLDVGCGDLEVVRDFHFLRYTGLDVSKNVIERASKIKPNWNFLYLDNWEKVPTAEVVLCFEVLIHQNTWEKYYQLVNNLASHCSDRLIVSGYNSEPLKKHSSHMTYYYEPLMDTLKKTESFSKISVVGQHTGVDIVAAYKRR